MRRWDWFSNCIGFYRSKEWYCLTMEEYEHDRESWGNMPTSLKLIVLFMKAFQVVEWFDGGVVVGG